MNNDKALAVGGTIKLFDCEWQIEGIHLGSLGQESLYQLKSLTHKPGWTGQWEYHPMVFVPEPFIRQALTPQSSADLGSEDVCMCGNYEKDHTGYEGHTFTSTGTHDSGYKVIVREALLSAKNFIQNGVELGFIRMPDADTPDQAHNTLPKINEALRILDEVIGRAG